MIRSCVSDDFDIFNGSFSCWFLWGFFLLFLLFFCVCFLFVCHLFAFVCNFFVAMTNLFLHNCMVHNIYINLTFDNH